MNKINKERGNCIRQAILRYVIKYIEEHGYSPSRNEIADAVGLKAKSTVSNHLKKMIEEGTLETDAGPATPRALRVPGYKFVKAEDL